MDTSKVYFDSEGNECSIWRMVKREPTWAAVRIQEGEKAIDEITTLRQQLAESEARVAELLTICQAVQRDLLLRAEPDWDGSGQKVVNLSAGFWEELNRVIGKYDDTACKSFDAVILRKQAEAVEAVADKLEGMDLMYPDEFLRSNAQRLRQQADELEK